MKIDDMQTAIRAVERLHRLEAVHAAALAAARAINLLALDDLPDDADGAASHLLAAFNQLVDVQDVLAPLIKQTRGSIRAAQRMAAKAGQP